MYSALIAFGSLLSCLFKRKDDENILLLRLLLCELPKELTLVMKSGLFT